MEPRRPSSPPPVTEPVETTSKLVSRGRAWAAIRDVSSALGSAAGVITYGESKAGDKESERVPPPPLSVKKVPTYGPRTKLPRGTNDLYWADLEPGEALAVGASENAVVFCRGMVSIVSTAEQPGRIPCTADGTLDGGALASVAYADHDVLVFPQVPCQCVKIPKDNISLIALVIMRDLDRLHASGLLAQNRPRRRSRGGGSLCVPQSEWV